MKRLTALAAVVLTTACADYAPIYAGQIRGTDAAIAMVIEDNATTIYACGGKETVTTHTHWFSATGDPTRASFNDGRWSVDVATVDGAAAEGALVTSNGTRLPFTLAATDERPLTRLYRSEIGGCPLGVIAYGDSTGEQQIQGAYCDEDGVVGQVTPVDIGPDMALVEIQLTNGITVVEPEALGAFSQVDG